VLGCSVRLRIKVKVGKWHKEAFSRVQRRIMASVTVRLNLGFRDRDGVYG